MKISLLKKKGRYFSVKLTGNDLLYRIHPDTMFEFSLYEGKEFESEDWNRVLVANDYAFGWESTLRMLSIRAHCEQEMKNKLRQKKFSASNIVKIIAECKRLDLIDDAKFAKLYIAELKEKGAGRQMIKVKLSKKGVSWELIEEELELSFSKDDEFEAAKIALQKKMPSLKRESDPRKRKEKLYRYMASRGFQYDMIEKVSGFLD